jgi:predicted RNA-binding Zn ribbon-like protein
MTRITDTVENTKKFKFIGGNISLDFVNTVYGRISNPNKRNGRDYYDAFPAEKMENYADLIGWSVKAGLFDETQAKKLLLINEIDPQAAEAVLKRAYILRESLYRIFKSVVEGWQPEAEDLRNLNRELSIARRHKKLSIAENSFVFEWISRAEALDAMLWQISESAADMLVNGDLRRIRRCVNNTCNWLFLDTSRSRTRQWCVMKDCGNAAKVRRFRTKRKAEQ